jgi:hypothetical protein
VRTTFLMCTLALLAACSDEAPPQQSAAPPEQTAQAAAPQEGAPAEKADMAAAEVTEQTEKPVDPCDLSGYDMNKMTVPEHEELVKICAKSKQ